MRVEFGAGAEAEESREPGKSQPGEDGEIEPEGLNVLEFGGEEALDVVTDDEFVEEGLAVGEVAGEVPGQGGEGGGQGSLPVAAVEPGDGEGQDEGDETFGENGEAEGGAGGPRALFEGEVEVKKETDAQGDIGDGDLGETEPAEGGAEDESGLEGGESEEQAEGGQSDREAGGEIRGNGQMGEGGDEPIEERWLFEPRLAPEDGGDPVAAGGHVLADRGVARLIGAEQAA